MGIDIEKEKNRLAQGKFVGWVRRQVAPSEMLAVFLKDEKDEHDITVYCALVPNDRVEIVLGNTSWDLQLGDGLPGSVIYHRGEEKRIEYQRFGNDEGVEPLVIYRHFHNMREPYLEISEEFRLFHQLCYDRKQDRYTKFDRAGNENLVVVARPERVEVRLLEIRQFLAIKEMHLAVMFDCRENSEATVEELGLAEGGQDRRDGLMVYSLGYADLHGPSGKHAFSRLLGKCLVPPLTKEKSGFWGFAPEDTKTCLDFIIGVDESGKEILNTSDEGKLSDYFGGNPGRPHYLTPVHFRREVLDKYYQQPGRYSVEDGYLRCGGLWGMTMDNHQSDRVVAWLGDLGRDLPHEEQLHWRSYNTAPAGGVSATFFKRQILAQFANSDRPEHVFKHLYQNLQESCRKTLGWAILLPLAPEDAHCLQSLRVPASEEQKDFDDLVLALAKILVDSLNEKELNKFISASDRQKVKGGISRLEKTLAARGVNDAEEHVTFLRNLQRLRSSGTAHRKGSNYRKIAEQVDVDNRTLPSVFHGILDKGTRFLVFLNGVVQSGVLGSASEVAGTEKQQE